MDSLGGRLWRLGAPWFIALVVALISAAPAAAAAAATSLSAWGDNSGGELGNGTVTESNSPVAVPVSGVEQVAAGARFTIALVLPGKMLAWGENQFGQLGDGTQTDSSVPVAVKGPQSGVAAVAAGGGHSLALLSSGRVLAWGDNAFGQLGDVRRPLDGRRWWSRA